MDNKIIKRRQTKICKATTYLLTMFYALKFSRVQMSSVNRLRFGRQPPLTVSRTSHKSLTDSDGIRTFGRNVSSLNVLTLVIQFIEAEACVVAMIFFFYHYLLLFLVFENNLFHLWYFKSNFYGCYIWIVVFLQHCYRSQKEKIGYMNNTRLIIFNPLLIFFAMKFNRQAPRWICFCD